MRTNPASLARRGTIYLMVMATVVIVVALVLTGAALVRLQKQTADLTIDMTEARIGAFSAVEYAAAYMDSNTGWRTALAATGGDGGAVAVGRGKVSFTVSDPVDGNLTNSASDPVDVVGTAVVGGATQICTARLTPVNQPMSCLGAGLVVGGTATITSGTLFGTDRISSNSTIVASTARVWVNAEAVGSISGSTFYGTTGTVKTATQMPDATVFDYYKSVGTQLTSSGMSGQRIELCVLSPSSNPYGTRVPNANGIYWLDCGGQDYTIQNCRIVGTLVLLNAGSGSMVAGAVTWDPVSPEMPALLVQGSAFTIQTTGGRLIESSANFNPPGTPWNGVTNATNSDVYPSRIKGLVYCSGNLTVQTGDAVIDGVVVVGGKLSVTSTLTVFYSDTCYYNPPPGFRSATVMTLVPGSFAQVVH